MNDLAGRLNQMEESLMQFKASDYPSWGVGPPYNALIAAAKEQCPDDPVVQSIRDTGKTMSGGCSDNAGAMRANLNQVLAAMGETGPVFDLA
jgi:hypothetical protein